MRRIEFIAPVESMRGNLGTRQNLVYAPNNNRAFDSIEGQVNPALNYESRLIGAKGKRNYFCVKTKSSVHLTQKSKAAMADFGGVGAVYAAIVRDKASLTYIKINGIYQKGVDEGHIHMSFRKYLSRYIGYMLKNKLLDYTFTDGIISVGIGNPWVSDNRNPGAAKVDVGDEILVKFWLNLAVRYTSTGTQLNPIIFKIDNNVGLSFNGMDFESVTDDFYNILDLTTDGDGYVKYGDLFVLDVNGNYMAEGWPVTPNGQYHTTNVAP